MLSSGSACRGEGGQKRSPKTKLIPETFGTNWRRENTWIEFSKVEKEGGTSVGVLGLES